MKNKFIWLLLLTVSFSACNKKTALTKDTHNASGDDVAVIMKAQPEYHFLSIRSAAEYKTNATSQSFNSNIRIEKGKKIWLTINGPLNIEVGRVLILPDSVYGIDRLNKKYYAESIDALGKKLGFSLQFNQIEFLFTSALDEQSIKQYNLTKQDESWSLTKQDARFTERLSYDAKTKELQKIRMNDILLQRELNVNFSNFLALEGEKLAYDRSLKFTDRGYDTEVNLQYQRANIEAVLEFPFEINKTYERAEF